MRIADINLAEIEQAWRNNRAGLARSPDVAQYIEVISSLEPGTALSVVVADDRTVTSVKTQLTNAAKAVGKNLDVVGDEVNRRVMFALSK